MGWLAPTPHNRLVDSLPVLVFSKMQVAGESGHGKTSFINNLFLSYTEYGLWTAWI